VAECSATTIQRVPPVKYRHTILCIEATYYLQKISTPAMAFTNKTDNLQKQIEKLFYKVEILPVPQTPRFHLSDNLIYFIFGVRNEEFQFEADNLRNVLDKMLAVTGARVKIKALTSYDNIEIDFIDQNAINNRIETIKAITRTKSQSIDYLAGNLEALADNLTSNQKTVWHPSPTGYDSLKTTEPIVTTSNAKILLNFPIENVVRFIIKCKCHYHKVFVPDGGGTNLEINVEDGVVEEDISEYILDKEVYDLLPNYGIPSKQDRLYFERGKKEIDPVGYHERIFGLSVLAIEYVLQSSMNSNPDRYTENGDIPDEITQVKINSIADAMFRLEYIPRTNVHAKLGKYDITNPALSKTSMYDNQSEKTIDLTRFGANLFGKVNRTGNKEMTIDDALDLELHSISELLQPGDLLYNEYIVVSRTYSIFDHSIKVQYKLSKDYNNISERISINRERRLYNIPLESLKRDVLIKDWIIASTTAKVVTKPSFLANSGLLAFLNTLANVQNLPISNAVIMTITKDVTGYGYYELNLFGSVMANTLNFKAKFFDNYSVGFSVQAEDGSSIIGGTQVNYNAYVDGKGEFETMWLRLTANANYPVTGVVETDFNSQITAAKKLPKTELSYYTGRIYTDESNALYIKKDGYEALELSYVLEGRPSITDVNKIVFGFPFFTKNNLMGFVSKTLHVYASITEYSPFENYKVKGDVCSATFQIEDNCIQLYGDLSMIVTRKAWALGDEEGNLYIACNCPTKSRIYFYSSSDLL
jgi:hypothetical protein